MYCCSTTNASRRKEQDIDDNYKHYITYRGASSGETTSTLPIERRPTSRRVTFASLEMLQRDMTSPRWLVVHIKSVNQTKNQLKLPSGRI